MNSCDVQGKSSDTRVYEGWNIGAVSVKRVWLHDDDRVRVDVRRHAGEPDLAIRQMIADTPGTMPAGVIVTGPQASTIVDLPYLPESICLESALKHLRLTPDLVLSLGGETFLVYCMADGVVRNMISSNRCAAGSGEFLVQQFGRMNLGLDTGLQIAEEGRRVSLASRCSVHCKSDATHKLNKGECTRADIAFSLIGNLAAKISQLVESANWPTGHILGAGGLVGADLLVSELKALIPGSRIEILPQSAYLEAFGAAVSARAAGPHSVDRPDTWVKGQRTMRFTTRPSLKGYSDSVTYLAEDQQATLATGMELVLGVDAGSTTTKEILYDRKSRQVVAGCYLRTHGNPVQATSQCLSELQDQLVSAGVSTGREAPRIIQVAVTGSGRDLVSVYLNNCLSFNEILAHARAAREAVPEVDTLFELGGQDAKFVSLHSGIPVDYTMNDGCSAGTGSFLEEAAASDMQVPMEEIGPLALSADHPVAFGERCAAFINSEVRSALQQGAPRADVLAGLVYSITDNYLARVVGARNIGRTILLQGGVALNPALAPAVAARTGMNVTVPSHPELMGCVGAAQMAIDLLDAGLADKWSRELGSFGTAQMETKGTFNCRSCENHCEVRQIALNDQIYPFGGLCAKWEMQRRPKALRYSEGKDLVSLRSKIMFKDFACPAPEKPKGRIGLPLALSTYELYPFYASLLTSLGYEVVLSRPGKGNRRTLAPACYPGEILHAAVDDLLAQGTDFVFLPYLREFPIPGGHEHAYACPIVQDYPGVIKTIFEADADRILSPEIGLSSQLITTTRDEIGKLAKKLGVPIGQAKLALHNALKHQREFEHMYQQTVQAELKQSSAPIVILLGRPYAAYASEVNLSVPRKITSRGFTVVPGDALPFAPEANERDIWHFTQKVVAAIEYSRKNTDCYVCVLSCFSCGPDAITHHRVRHELEGEPYCFLEIDSHTAHAGIETRIGAFLDIIEERRRRKETSAAFAHVSRPKAHLEQRGGKLHIIDAAGERVRLDDKRVLHVLLADLPWTTANMFASFYSTLGWRAITTSDMDFESMQAARKVCSGRECIPFLAMMGKAVTHLQNRPHGEITAFHLLDQEGPCQNGNWYDALPMILGRLGMDNAVGVWPTIKNNYLGGGDRAALLMTAANNIGDLTEEARTSLRCLAKEPESALALLHELEVGLVNAGRRGLMATEAELRRVAKRLGEVPLNMSPREATKVLLFGGINRIFVDKPVREFFEQRGILAKTNDISEFLSLLEYEWIRRSGFAHGHVQPGQYYSWSTILRDLISGSDRRASLRAIRARMHCQVIEMLEKRWRGIMNRSGLLFAAHTPFRELVAASHDTVSWNGGTEAPCTLGRYFSCIKGEEYDGYINVGAFNCAPANTASAVIGGSRRFKSTPYAVIEADGTAITPSQVRQLETVAAQCTRDGRSTS